MKIYDEEETVISRPSAVVEAEEVTVAEERGAADAAPEISVFLPVLNEEPNLRPLHAKLDESLATLGHTAEIIYVDDGSTDGSLEVLKELAARDPRVRVIALRRNYGQTAAMAAGIDAARGEVLIPMDADLQNDPVDIARLMAKLDEGFDVVSGWRKERQDKMVTRKIPSAIANCDHLVHRRRQAPRLRVLSESLPARVPEGGEALRRDAPLHPDLRESGSARASRRFPSGTTRARWASRSTDCRAPSR